MRRGGPGPLQRRLGRRQQAIGEARLMSESLSSAPRKQSRANSRALRSDDTEADSSGIASVDQTEACKALEAMAPCRSKGMSTRDDFFVTVR
jgi:hypothetical protein